MIPITVSEMFLIHNAFKRRQKKRRVHPALEELMAGWRYMLVRAMDSSFIQ